MIWGLSQKETVTEGKESPGSIAGEIRDRGVSSHLLCSHRRQCLEGNIFYDTLAFFKSRLLKTILLTWSKVLHTGSPELFSSLPFSIAYLVPCPSVGSMVSFKVITGPQGWCEESSIPVPLHFSSHISRPCCDWSESQRPPCRVSLIPSRLSWLSARFILLYPKS